MTDVVELARDPDRSSLRVWERHVAARGDDTWIIPLRFRAVPGTWPEIELTAPEGTITDVRAEIHQVELTLKPGMRGTVEIEIGGLRISLVGRLLRTEIGDFPVPGSGPIALEIVLTAETAAVVVDSGEPIALSSRAELPGVTASPTSENIVGFRVPVRPSANGRIVVGRGAELLHAMVYGLRPHQTPLYRRAEQSVEPGGLFYSSDLFSVADGSVADRDGVPALVPDRCTIVSPIRVVEEFAWRDTGNGDMTRVVDRSEMWRSTVEPGRFPDLRSGIRSLDATFALALETFQRNSSGEFSLPGETGVWSAGYFQGPGAGFGSWKRDTSHIALRAGNLIDPAVARASLVHVVNAGFDNGSDGESLPAVAIWDYLLATGDESIVPDTWEALARLASGLDDRFDERRGLVRAPQSTSNDLFSEPEAGGFALSTEIYTMATYAALSKMAALCGTPEPGAARWAERASTMKSAILAQYWSTEHEYFTSGPIGSESHRRGFWETSGAEAAVWGFLGPEVDAMTRNVLAGARRVAMSEYGLVLFPYRDDDNHFCHSVWYCWQAGIARAAAQVGDAELVRQLLGQQARSAVLNKTFYEVTDAVTGVGWRWPGQLWQAAGFVSLVLYGLLGIRYDGRGMTFTPAVVPDLAGVRVEGLRYRGAILDIEVLGHGTRCVAMLDGRPVQRVEADCTGRHSLVLKMAS